MNKYQWFEGLKFTRDENTGYYLNSTHRIRMHRCVWSFYNGEIPKGYHIHHVDGDKANNNICNLELMSASEHLSMHGKEQSEKNYDRLIYNLDNIVRPKASEWHGSEEGLEWHKGHWEKGLKKWMESKVELKCLCCGNKYMTIDSGKPKFCSNKCKSKHRRESGVDDVVRECKVCNKEFKINKYSKTATCSIVCNGISRRKK